MERNKRTVFYEKISPFLKGKMEKIKKEKGEDSQDYKALFLQYKRLELEELEAPENNVKHYEADVGHEIGERRLTGIERLYRTSLVIEPTMICAAHCRYCLRANYGMFNLSEDELEDVARFCGSGSLKDELREVLITGGDPFIVPKRLNFLVEALMKHAPNVKIMRIATRLITQDPNRIGNDIFEIFKNKPNVKFEIATQINHPVEFFPETIEKINMLLDCGVTIYSQNVLLKGVNDDIYALSGLYDKMREFGLESHYLFHCVPLKGMHHLRTSVAKGLKLIRDLVNSGIVSGRVKPMYAVMTDIGKITLYEDTIVKKDNSGRMLLQSDYRYKDRLRWNPNWKLPKTAEIDENGMLRVWYLDGKDD